VQQVMLTSAVLEEIRQMAEWGWLSNSDFSKLISIDEESEEPVPEENSSLGATRGSLEPTLKCGACGSRIFVIDYCSKTFAERSMATKRGGQLRSREFARPELQSMWRKESAAGLDWKGSLIQ